MIKKPETVICLIAFLSAILILAIPLLIYLTIGDLNKISQNYWPLTLLLNTCSYATVLLPGYLIYKYVKATRYLNDVKSSDNILQKCLRMCLLGQETNESEPKDKISQTDSSKFDFLKTPLCFSGLLGPYLISNYLEEKIMTQKYTNSDKESQNFKDSQFLVFATRVLAVVLSGSYLLLTKQPPHTPPFYKYTYSSLSNIISSWCQYEALKYVSFPTQVLAKAAKIIPVMILGKIISQEKYEAYEYVTAVGISIGMALFLFGDLHGKKSDATVTTASGLLLLMGYVVFDSFTSSWQGAMFTQYHVSSVQMMCGVNAFSCLLLFVPAALEGSMTHSLSFMTKFPSFAFDCLIYSIGSTASQFFIVLTIAYFGPVVFTIFISLRQVLSVLLSYCSYSHGISTASILGMVTIFIATFLRLYCDHRMKVQNKSDQVVASTHL